MKGLSALGLCMAIAFAGHAQISAKLIKYVDVSQQQIAFVYGGDIWVVDKEGGQAVQLTQSPGEESYPKFSPDGREIAFTASYRGNLDVYVMPSTGGIPTRVTYASFADRMVDWHPDGNKLLFASQRQAGITRVRQFFEISKDGGLARKLNVPYGELASYSPDGNQLAYITKITENYPFKRYRGGLTSDVLIYDFVSNNVERITEDLANDGKPAWSGDVVYFLSDRDDNLRRNVWAYNTNTEALTQLTNFTDFDITYLAAGPEDLVYEAGGTLYRMQISSKQQQEVSVNVVSDLMVEIPRMVKVGGNISDMSASPGGKRIVFEARGELFDVPVKEGFTQNLTQSSGAFDRQPAWSPDGKHIAYWSDLSGENEIYLRETKVGGSTRKISNRGKGFGYALYWSPDSKMIAFMDETNTIQIINVASGEVTTADNYRWNFGHNGRFSYPISWSSDSKWLAYVVGEDNANNSIFLYDIDQKQKRRVTSGFYSDFYPVFSTDGKYLFFLTDRDFTTAYSGLGDGTWIYPNNTNLAALALTKDAPNLLSAKNDALPEEKEEEPEEDSDEKKKKGKKDDEKEEEKESVAIKIDWDDLESRVMVLPAKAGNLINLMAFEGKVVYRRFPVTGAVGEEPQLMYYDLKEREEKTIMKGINSVKPTADGKSLLIRQKGQFAIIEPNADQKIKKSIPTGGLAMQLQPREEWRQIFHDTWRRYRDFFYDKDMQQVDWEAMKERYAPLVEEARTRWDIGTIQFNLLSELSAGHTYSFGGDTERVENISTGYLGIDWAVQDGYYVVDRIVRPAAWDTETRSPFDLPGVDVQPGDRILAVNGIPLDLEKSPYAAFEGLNGKTAAVMVSRGGAEPKQMIVKCLSERQERNLRYLEWIEGNRKKVDELSDGQLGYVYMSNTGGRGQLELVKMFYGQLAKKGFVIDERFNGGGQLADRFLELIKRPVVYNLYWRHGKEHGYPIKANKGPKGMIINGWAGSGGDGLPWAFQELEAGPIVGERTLGILVGPATGHRLIDGGGITVPGARLYDNDGHWFWEGEGVTPDIKVWDDPNLLMQGRDPQLERTVQEVLKLIPQNPTANTPVPAFEDRTAEGLNGGK